MGTQSMIRFDIRLWRNIVNRASEDLAVICGAPVQAISPFGFEVFRDDRFLWKKLRRFYCYLGSKDVSTHDLSTIENLFADALHARLSDQWPDMAQQIIAYKTRSTIQWVRASDNRSLRMIGWYRFPVDQRQMFLTPIRGTSFVPWGVFATRLFRSSGNLRMTKWPGIGYFSSTSWRRKSSGR
jgi:hypothetical protein